MSLKVYCSFQPSIIKSYPPNAYIQSYSKTSVCMCMCVCVCMSNFKVQTINTIPTHWYCKQLCASQCYNDKIT